MSSNAPRVVAQIGFTLLVIAAGVAIAALILELSQDPPPVSPPDNSPIVSSLVPAKQKIDMDVTVHGKVRPPSQSTVVAQVGGQITQVQDDFLAGMLVNAKGNKGTEPLIVIDDADYQVALASANAQLSQAQAGKAQAEASAEQAQSAEKQAKETVTLRQAQLQQAKAALGPAEAAVWQARAALSREQAEAAAALTEWKRYNEDSDARPSDLLLRKPQLAAATAQYDSAKDNVDSARANVAAAEATLKLAEEGIVAARKNANAALKYVDVAAANIDAAQAALDKANLDLTRTKVFAPFKGRIVTVHVNLGQYVMPGTPLFSIYPVDVAEVLLPVPQDQAGFLELPLTGEGAFKSSVTLTGRVGGKLCQWEASIHRILPEIDRGTGTIGVIARVNDPYNAGKEPLINGQFVRATIQGKSNELYVVDRSAFRDSAPQEITDSEDAKRLRNAGYRMGWVLLVHELSDSEVDKLLAPPPPDKVENEDAPDPEVEASRAPTPARDQNHEYAKLTHHPVVLVRSEAGKVYLDISEPALPEGKAICTSPLSIVTEGMLVRLENNGTGTKSGSE